MKGRGWGEGAERKEEEVKIGVVVMNIFNKDCALVTFSLVPFFFFFIFILKVTYAGNLKWYGHVGRPFGSS